MRIWILTSGFRDLEAGRRFYERQAECLGEHFLTCLYLDIDRLKSCAGIHRKVFGYHRLLSKRFPFAIYYQLRMDEVIVHRVLDCRQDPRRLAAALRDTYDARQQVASAEPPNPTCSPT